MEYGSLVTLELSTGDVETVVEVQAQSPWEFVGDIAGNLEMVFGTSLYSVGFSSIANSDMYKPRCLYRLNSHSTNQ